MLNKELPFLRICLPLCLGIITGTFLHPSVTGCMVPLILSFIILLLSLLCNKRLTNPLFGAAFLQLLFVTGILLIRAEQTSLSDLKQEPSLLSCVVSDYPAEKENSFMITLRMKSLVDPGKEEGLKGSIIVYLRKDSIAPALIPGDSVLIRCTPLPITNRGNPYEFNYRSYMAGQGIKYYAFCGRSDLLSIREPSRRPLIYRALIIRNRIIEMFRERGITGQRLALVSAITLGEKSHLDLEQKQYFINAGIMHIMAVSGLHAVILSYFIFTALFFLKGRLNIIRILISILFLWAFAFITGLTPSVLRATIMFSFLHAGKLLKRPANPLNSVLASAFILILIRPSVIYDAGFLLSYAAVFYIILFYRDLYLKISFKRWLPDIIWQSAAVTITAQAGTLPLTILLFNRFPLWFILTNVVIVPVSSLLIITGCLVPLTYPLVSISTFFATIVDKLTWLTEFLTERAASLPLATIDNIGLTQTEALLLTVAVTLSLFYMLKKESVRALYPIGAFLIFFIVMTGKLIHVKSTNEIIVYNSYGGTAVGLRNGSRLILYSDSTVIPKEVSRHSSVLGLKVTNILLGTDPLYLKIDKHAVMITGKYDDSSIVPSGTELLILTSKKPFSRKDKFPDFPDGVEVITTQFQQEVQYGVSAKMKTGMHTLSIRRSGAYRKRL